MPSKNLAQHNLMAMVAHNPKAAKRVGIPQSVGREFVKADTGRTFSKGGDMKGKKDEMMHHEIHAHHMKMAHHHLKEAMKHGGHVKGYAAGGDVTGVGPSRERRGLTMEKMAPVKAGGIKKHGEHAVQEHGHTRGRELGVDGKKSPIQGGAKGGKGAFGAAPIAMRRGGRA
jgi:hypothetical protein